LTTGSTFRGSAAGGTMADAGLETEAASLAAAAAAGSFAALALRTTQLQANKAIRLRMGIQ
jgi:hypothetical protein